MARRLHFTKMHGFGNDFVVIDGVRQIFTPQKALIKKWADRHRGVGFDQLLLVEKADYPQHDFKYRIFNRDGSEVEQCGNGARCFAKFVYLSGLSTKKSLQVETMKGILQLTLLVDGQVKVVFPPPILDLNKIPFVPKLVPKPGLAAPPGHCQWVLLRGEKIPVLCVNVGNPHAVVWVEDIAKAPLATLGKEIAQSEQFPEGVNVGFAQKRTLSIYFCGCGREALAKPRPVVLPPVRPPLLACWKKAWCLQSLSIFQEEVLILRLLLKRPSS